MSWIPPEVEPPRTRTSQLAAARGVFFAVLLGVACAACSETSDVADLADELAPHENAMARYLQWVERTTHSVRPGERERARLDETLFSPVRTDPRFRVVVVEALGRSPWRAVHPSDVEEPELAWRSIRTRTLGTLDAAHDPHDASVVWARLEREGLRVIVAIQRPPAAVASPER